jgi:cellulose synthase/poly-beta-1,6-N-acetylglucosamine synthase-like glycosyltransferase
MLLINDALLLSVLVWWLAAPAWRGMSRMCWKTSAEGLRDVRTTTLVSPGLLDPIANEYIRRHSDDSAYFFLSSWQIAFYALVFQGALYLLLTDWLVLMTLGILCMSLVYLSCVAFRLTAVCLSLSGKGVIEVTSAQLQSLRDAELPIYTILVPLYKEANIANSIVSSLGRLDYPPECLDIKLLLEEDDQATIDAVRRISIDERYELIVVNNALPKTKPKACNHGLARARGQFCVIYDAEDQPEPDQLKKAVYAFRHVDRKVICLQAKLNYRNPRQNCLTRWFTIEYTMWFDFLLPGLWRLGAPIPLGGTSNHFRTDVLHNLNGWDPFNVTEDCDLGIRICKAGYKTAVLESTTWEEANSDLRNWINQRSRWMKGFFQTHIAHMRRPGHLVWSIGLWRSLCFWLSVGAVSATQVLNLVFWAISVCLLVLLASDVISGRGAWEVVSGHRNEYRLAWKLLYWGPGESPFWSGVSIALFALGCVLFLANGLFIAINALACFKRGNLDLICYAVLSPLYWLLMSVAACKGFVQLFTRRFYWEKTVHGLDGSVVEPSMQLDAVV